MLLSKFVNQSLNFLGHKSRFSLEYNGEGRPSIFLSRDMDCRFRNLNRQLKRLSITRRMLHSLKERNQLVFMDKG